MKFDYYLDHEHKNVLGWCDKDKAEMFYDIITKNKSTLCVEIGVFGGSSFVPQAIAMKENGTGLVIGIDPWENQAAIEEMENAANKRWWSDINFEEIYQKFLSYLKQYEIEEFSKIYRDKSENIIQNFQDESVDVLHIDGNHCEKLAYQDAVMFLPKVKKGGYVFFDDTSWSENGTEISTAKGLNYLLQYCEKICVTGKDCVVLKKI